MGDADGIGRKGMLDWGRLEGDSAALEEVVGGGRQWRWCSTNSIAIIEPLLTIHALAIPVGNSTPFEPDVVAHTRKPFQLVALLTTHTPSPFRSLEASFISIAQVVNQIESIGAFQAFSPVI